MTAFSSALYLYNALCTMHAGETMHCQPCYNDGSGEGERLAERFLARGGLVAMRSTS